MRTLDEIVARMGGLEDDFFGFQSGVLLDYMPFEQAQPFLKDGVTAEEWGDAIPLTDEKITQDMREYMTFAWEKAEDHRGLSAGRSVQKMQVWLWLLGNDLLVTFAEDEDNYPSYGAPILKRICETYDFPIPESNALANMARGQKCRSDCDEGC